jgi:hypothetical protein
MGRVLRGYAHLRWLLKIDPTYLISSKQKVLLGTGFEMLSIRHWYALELKLGNTWNNIVGTPRVFFRVTITRIEVDICDLQSNLAIEKAHLFVSAGTPPVLLL